MSRRTRKALTLVAALFLVAAQPMPSGAQSVGQLIFQKNSLYHRIFVERSGTVVTLRFSRRRDRFVQSVVDLSDPGRHMAEYTQLAFCGLLLNPEPKRMLILGLGGGVLPREMHHYFPDMQIVVVEIDPEIPRIAEEFFGFRQDRNLRVHISDGRVFVRNLLREEPVPKYDYVILDAFNSDYIPFHLMTREFLEMVKDVLGDDGVVVANVLYTDRLFDAELKTLTAAFGQCQAFLGAHSTNAMLVSSKAADNLLSREQAAERAGVLQERHWFTFDLREVAERLRPGIRAARRARVLTDDRGPANRLRQQHVPRAQR